MRELTISELDEVSGGCCGGHPFYNLGCGNPAWNSCSTTPAQTAAFAGYIAGRYDVMVDIYNHADCATMQADIAAMSADMRHGYTAGSNMTAGQANSLLNNVVSSIHSAISFNGCGQLSMVKVDFPPSGNNSGALGRIS